MQAIVTRYRIKSQTIMDSSGLEMKKQATDDTDAPSVNPEQGQ
jgi:hypothetical protein